MDVSFILSTLDNGGIEEDNMGQSLYEASMGREESVSHIVQQNQ